MSKPIITIKNVSVRTPRSPEEFLLKNINFSVLQGEVFGVFGESGAGKSLLIKALTGFFPYEGSINIPKDIQLVPQNPSRGLNPRHTIRKSLQEPMVLRNDLEHVDERIQKALEEVHLDKACLDKFPHELSGGQCQRVCIMRALICKPKVVFWDEPTSALDAFVKSSILELMQEIKERHNLTYFFVAHSLVAMLSLCDRIAIMRQGHILEIVKKSDLMNMRLSHDYSKELVQAYKDLSR